VQTIKDLASENDLASEAASVSALEALQEALHRSDHPLSQDERVRMIASAAGDVANHTASADHLIELSNRYNAIRNTILAKWPELPFATRMMLREMVISHDRTQKLWEAMTEDDRTLFLLNMGEVRERFVFSLRQNILMSKEIRSLVQADAEVSQGTTSFDVWAAVKRADPKMEDALFKPLDPSKYVKRDMRKTPRRSA
jgi:hypothetical protein